MASDSQTTWLAIEWLEAQVSRSSDDETRAAFEKLKASLKIDLGEKRTPEALRNSLIEAMLSALSVCLFWAMPPLPIIQHV